MRCSVLLLASLALSAFAQNPPASQEEINRALEVLRQTPTTAPPPTARPGVPLTIITRSNMAPAKSQAPSAATSPLTADMEQRARELLQNTKVDPRPQVVTTPGAEAIERAKARDEMRKQAVEETRRGLPQAPSSPPGTLAEEQQRKAQEDIERQKNLSRIEMEVERTKLLRQQKATEAQAAKTNLPAPAVAVTPATPAPAPAVAVTPAPVPAPAPVPPPAAPAPQPVKPAPVVAVPPVTPPPAPEPVVVQPTPAPVPQTTQTAFKGLAPDMEQRARDILNKVISNTKDATVPPLATQPPRPALVIPGPQPSVEAQPSTTTATPVKGPDAPAAPVVAPPPRTTVAVPITPAEPQPVPAPAAPTPSPAPITPITPEQEAKARELLNQVNVRPAPAAPAPVAPAKPQPAPVAAPAKPQPAPVAATVPAPAKPVPAPQTQVPAPITPEQEAKARDLLNQLTARPAPAPAAPVASPAAPVPKPAPIAPERPQPATVVATPPPARPSPPAQAALPAAMPPDQETRARELLNQTVLPTPAPNPAAVVEPKTVNETDRRALEDAKRQAKLKAEIEEETRREIARMEEESQARAREMARRRLEDEKRAQRKPAPAATVRPAPEPEAKPVVAKPAEKPARAKKKTDAKSPATPAEESWKNTDKSREQRLAELLEAYRKDQISADKYHSERAKILASPQ